MMAHGIHQPELAKENSMACFVIESQLRFNIEQRCIQEGGHDTERHHFATERGPEFAISIRYPGAWKIGTTTPKR